MENNMAVSEKIKHRTVIYSTPTSEYITKENGNRVSKRYNALLCSSQHTHNRQGIETN